MTSFRDRRAGAEQAPSGFFVLRTPLLPFDELVAWSAELEAPTRSPDDPSLPEALARDREKLRARLREVVSRPAVREALFVASPTLDESIGAWLQEPESERGQKVERSLVRYFQRMAGRSTPFGLFSGWSVGSLAGETRLEVGAQSDCRRHTRLDNDYVFALCDALAREPASRETLKFRPNSSLYEAAGVLRYVEVRLDEGRRSYHLVAAECTDYLEATLSRARGGATLRELAKALAENDPDVDFDEAREYVGELADSQILVSDLAPPVTGRESMHEVLAQVRAAEQAGAAPIADVRARLEDVVATLAALDEEGLGAAPARYREIAQALEVLPAKVQLSRLFQVDMSKPAAPTLGRDVLGEIERGVDLLYRIGEAPGSTALSRFRDAFSARYEQREVPLALALDEEMGIGFDTNEGPSAEGSPLLAGLPFRYAGDADGRWSKRDAFLLKLLEDAWRRGAREIELKPVDLEPLMQENLPPRPDAYCVAVEVAAEIDGRPGLSILLDAASGPSGANLFGRFCHADEALHRSVLAHLREEEALRPDAVHAEVVHLPAGRIGNILSRPVLRAYEIPYLGVSGAPGDRQLPITDLFVSVRGSRVVLRSKSLGREVVPHLTTAHNYARGLGVYRFLCALQSQGRSAGVGWNWGALGSATFLPRVRVGRVVLSRARWRVGEKALAAFAAAKPGALYVAAQRLRAELRMPRLVGLMDADNVLPVDLDNILSIEAFHHVVKRRTGAVLVETLPGPEGLVARGPGGRFCHELHVPFVRRPAERPAAEPAPPVRSEEAAGPTAAPGRVFSLGSSWLYAKLYMGKSTADEVLREVVAPLVERVFGARAAEGWFFIRYSDPAPHLRLRFRGDPGRLRNEVLPALDEAIRPLLASGRIWRVQFDTYEREIERYGGPAGIEPSEALFQADSDAVLEILAAAPGDEGVDVRWRLALRGADAIFGDLGLDLDARLALARSSRREFGEEFKVDVAFERELGRKFRRLRAELEPLLEAEPAGGEALRAGVAALSRRSERAAAPVAALRAAAREGRLTTSLPELAASFVHMHVNRLLRGSQRAQELVLYDFLTRLYESKAARRRGR